MGEVAERKERALCCRVGFDGEGSELILMLIGEPILALSREKAVAANPEARIKTLVSWTIFVVDHNLE